MPISPKDLEFIRHRADLTDEQCKQLVEFAEKYPETQAAIEKFGLELKKLKLDEEVVLKISRALGPVLVAAQLEASEKAWSVVDKHLEKLREMSEEHDDYLKKTVESLEKIGSFTDQRVEVKR